MNNKGFTLIELLIAVAIILIVLVGSLLAFVQLMLLNESSRNLVIAANDAQYILEEMKNLAYDDLGSYLPNENELDSLEAEDVELTYNIESDVTTVTVNVTWQERQNERDFSLSTCFTRE
ncbi:MAG: prepilin-type N-terminal cleavage/methylation domain-containing protein [Candidatus Omnitrophica bacterium]|jgi:prepilin-type N-terminal cleavage/methylation domain-containing protein|nr:prepilin-type N-terminal cleavage/methylation domain-containing protein [Candidatus Omnitrophota bacterium]MDD4981916.1 prepilin-type N-terminal cleavage/methylation domain-containing protein [Candidatus Omnitrophota bacterium]MDD5665410.1 prepilin-type N-terminal cleavage/methylation domain-containing protein [Candidatus Omnitrophota bacterium]